MTVGGSTYLLGDGTGLEFPEPTFLVALTDPLSEFPETVDITQWMMTFDSTYGRQHELQQIEAQTITAVMDNVTGLFSDWNFLSPFTNQMGYVDSTLEGGNEGSWYMESQGIVANPALNVIGGGMDSTPTILLYNALGSTTAVGLQNGGDGGGVGPGDPTLTGIPVTAGNFYTAFASFLSLQSVRACHVQINWFDSGGSSISSSTGTAGNDSTSVWTKFAVTGQAPTGAVWATISNRIASVTAAEKGHLVQRFGITQRYTDNLTAMGQVVLDVDAWGPGGYGLTIGKPLVLQAQLESVPGTVFPIAFGYLEKNVPTIKNELLKTVSITAADGFKYYANETISSSLYPGVVVLDGATVYWRLGDPLNTILTDDFSNSGNLGVVTGAWRFQEPGLMAAPVVATSQDVTASTESTGSGTISTTSIFSPSTGAPGVSLEMLWMNATNPGAVSLAECAAGKIVLGLNSSGEPIAVVNGSTIATGGASVCNGTPHHLVLTYNNTSGAVTLSVDGLSVGTGTGTTGELSNAGAAEVIGNGSGFYQEFAFYPLVLSPTQIADHYDFSIAGFTIPGTGTTTDILILLFLLSNGFPLWMMEFEVGISVVQCPQITLGQTTLISTVNQIVASEQGLLYQDRAGNFIFLNRHYALSAPVANTVQAIFENAQDSPYLYLPTGFQPTLDDEDLWNDVPTQVSLNSAVVSTSPLYDVQDPNSIRRFGKRTLQGFTGMLYADDALETPALGQWLLALYSIPITRIRQAQISSAANGGSNLPQMLGRDLIDLLGFIYHPQDAGEDFNEEAQIESIKQSIRPGPLWITTYQLTPYLNGGNNWFTLNDAQKGQLAGPGSDVANKLAF